MSEQITITISLEQADAVVSACNCASVAAEGKIDVLVSCWAPSDEADMRAANAYKVEQAELAQEVAAVLRPQIDDAYKRDPRLQDLLHKVKMYRKYGRIPES